MKVVMAWDAFRTMRAYVNASYPKDVVDPSKVSLREISGWGLVDQMADGNLFVSEVLLMPQEASWGHIELSMDGWGDLIQQLADEGRGEVLGKLHMWWHSHPFGSHPQFSSIDTGTMEKFKLQDGYLLSIVTSEKGQMSARYDQWTPSRMRLELEVEVQLPDLSAIDVDSVRDEVIEKVEFTVAGKGLSPVAPRPSGVGGGGRFHGRGWGDEDDWPDDWGVPGVSSKELERFEVWRVDVVTPYRVSSFATEEDAVDYAATLAVQLPANTYDVIDLDAPVEDDPNALAELEKAHGIRDI